MVHALEEAEEFSAIAQALTVNIGTLSPAWIASMLKTAECYTAQGKPSCSIRWGRARHPCARKRRSICSPVGLPSCAPMPVKCWRCPAQAVG